MTNAQPPVRTRSIQKELLLWLVVPVALLWIIDAFGHTGWVFILLRLLLIGSW